MTQNNTITLHTYSDLMQAQMMHDKLQDAGIESFLIDENVMGLDPVAGVELKVFEKDVEAAEMLIKSLNG